MITYTRTCTHSQQLTLSVTHALFLSERHTRTHTKPFLVGQPETSSPPHTHKQRHTHAHTLTDTDTLTLSRRHTQTLPKPSDIRCRVSRERYQGRTYMNAQQVPAASLPPDCTHRPPRCPRITPGRGTTTSHYSATHTTPGELNQRGRGAEALA